MPVDYLMPRNAPSCGAKPQQAMGRAALGCAQPSLRNVRTRSGSESGVDLGPRSWSTLGSQRVCRTRKGCRCQGRSSSFSFILRRTAPVRKPRPRYISPRRIGMLILPTQELGSVLVCRARVLEQRSRVLGMVSMKAAESPTRFECFGRRPPTILQAELISLPLKRCRRLLRRRFPR
jgi:hypothetical protein